VIVDPEGLRVEGALVDGVMTTVWRGDRRGEARLYLAWSVGADGRSLAREASVWALGGARVRAPRLAPCVRDPDQDSWSCPGDSLETALFRPDAIEFPLPSPEPRAR
jgi:hypothetical protein